MVIRRMSMISLLCLLVAVMIVPSYPGSASAANEDVVPIDWSLLGQGKPTGADAQRLEGILLNASKYAVTNWYNVDKNYDAQTGSYLTFGGNDASHIRPPADMAFALAVSLKLGVYDPSYTGVSVTDATNIAKKIVRSLAYRHKVNSSGGWGGDWQSASWAYSAGTAAWLLWDDITDATNRDYIRKMVEQEANRNFPVYYYRNASGTIVRAGDSGAEENGWNAMIIELATAMMPNHDNKTAWMNKMLKLQLAAAAMPADVNSSTVVNGRELSDWLDGSNVNSNGTVVNHGGIHPSYMSFGHSLLSTALLYGMIDQDVPQAAKFNLDKVYEAFVDLNFSSPPYDAPGGTIYKNGTWEIYYPELNDKGTSYIAPHLAEDALARAFDLDNLVDDPAEYAGYWEDLHANKIVSMQSRFADGHTYLNATEMPAVIREEQAAKLYAKAYWVKWIMHQNTVHFTNQAYGSTGPIPDENVFGNGFNYMTSGQAPTNWVVETSAGGSAVVADYPSASNKSLKLDDTNSDNIAVSRSFSPITDLMSAEWSMLLPVERDYYGVQLMNGATRVETIGTFNGDLTYTDSAGTRVMLQAYDANQWYTVKIVADISTGKSDIYVNGTLRADDVNFTNAAGQIDKIRISTSNPNSGIMYIDEVHVMK